MMANFALFRDVHTPHAISIDRCAVLFKFKPHNCRILVVDDVMLNRYWFGEVNRLTREAPVPLVKVGQTKERLGGAANVALNAMFLGAQTSLLSVIGYDDAGAILLRLLIEGASRLRSKSDLEHPTIVKLRVICHQQLLLRIDFETLPSHVILQAKHADFAQQVAGCDLVSLSDYGEGGLTHIAQMIRVARNAGNPFLIAPKGGDCSKYAGATVITPNLAELREVVTRRPMHGRCSMSPVQATLRSPRWAPSWVRAPTWPKQSGWQTSRLV